MRMHGLAILSVICLLQTNSSAQEPADRSDTASALSRPCQASSPASSRKDKAKANSAASRKATVSACLEARDSPLNIQEFFQSYARSQGWRFGKEEIVADGLMFARRLDKEELLQFAREGRFAGRVNWTEGKALVLVTTRELEDGFTRVEVAARLQGFGESVDRFAPAKDSWDLDSSGLLEKSLIAALDAHMRSRH